MEIYKNCATTILYFDGDPAAEDHGYLVRISEGSVEIAYDDDEGPVCYRGKNPGNGHYLLEAPERRGRATLHRMPGSKIMEGYWEEDGYRGMWRILLK